MDNQQLLRLFPDIEYDEMALLIKIAQTMEEKQQQSFLIIYQGRRKKSNELLLFAALGFIGLAGIHRILIGDIALGIIYFLTGGFCLIGTIIDIINIKNLANRYNEGQAYEAVNLVNMSLNK